MAKFVGRRAVIGAAKEASRGVPLSPTLFFGRNTVSFDDRVTTAREEEGLGRIEDSDANFVTQRMGEGEIEMDLEDKNLGLILTSLMGASPVTTGSNPYTHAYTLQNTNQHQSLSLYYEDPNESRVFPNAVVDTLSISMDQEQIGRTTVGFKSKSGRDWTNQTESFTALGSKFLQQHTQVKLAAVVGDLAAASVISLKSLELNIRANTEYDNVLGTADPADVVNLQFGVEGSLTLNAEDATYRDYMINGTYRALEIKFNRSSSSSLTFQFPRVDFTEWERDRDNNALVSQSINFKGNYDAANGLAVISTCTLVNTYAGTAY